MNLKESLMKFFESFNVIQDKIKEGFENIRALHDKIKEDYGEREHQNKELCRRLNSKKKTYNNHVKSKKCVKIQYRTHRTQHRG